MNILALETSQPKASLCLSKNGEYCCDITWTAERNHDAWLFPALQQAMNCLADGEKLDYVLVGAGPGSYGGVRVALAAAIGIATVTGARVVTLCSWIGLAESDVGIVSDAKRGGWTLRRPDGKIEVLTPQELKAAANELKLATIEQSETVAHLDIPWIACHLTPSATTLCRNWIQMPPALRLQAVERPAEPIYVRPPHITKALHKPWEIRK